MIALFGGLGFLGRALTRRLVDAGEAVRVLHRSASAAERRAGVELARADLSEPASLEAGLRGCDTLVHLASTSVPGSAGADVVADAAANVVGTVALLEAARRCGVARIVFLSSGGAVYGRAAVVPTPEDQPLRPIGAYGAAKAAAEAYVCAHAAEHGTSAVVLRLSNVYGPGQSPFRGQGAVAAFTHRLLAGRPIELWGAGDVVRDYLYVEDAVDALALVLREPHGGFGVLNVGSGQGTSTLDLLRALESASGARAQLVHRPARAYDVPVSVLDVSRMQARGWAARTPLARGLSLAVGAARASPDPAGNAA